MKRNEILKHLQSNFNTKQIYQVTDAIFILYKHGQIFKITVDFFNGKTLSAHFETIHNTRKRNVELQTILHLRFQNEFSSCVDK